MEASYVRMFRLCFEIEAGCNAVEENFEEILGEYGPEIQVESIEVALVIDCTPSGTRILCDQSHKHRPLDKSSRR